MTVYKALKGDLAVNEFFVNKKIKGKIYSKGYMKKYGFQEKEDKWVWCKEISSKYSISMTIEIYKDDPENRVNIMVIDDDFGQVYDYQKIISKTPRHEVAGMIAALVEKVMAEMQKAKILSGHIKGEYI